jgi:hypothetical protein
MVTMPIERRTHCRKPVTTPYGVNILSLSGALLGVAVPADVSQGGFRADTSRAYRQGELLRLEIRNQHHLPGRQFPFVVAWSARETDGWQIGGRFMEPLTVEEAERLA